MASTPDVAQAAQWSPSASIKLPATATPVRRQRQRKPEAAQQEDANQGAGYADVISCGRARNAGVKSGKCISHPR